VRPFSVATVVHRNRSRRGNKAQAAHLLGIAVSTLCHKLKKLGP
jgi:DNA-binding protein Fis